MDLHRSRVQWMIQSGKGEVRCAVIGFDWDKEQWVDSGAV
jgi:hypothetical protein